MTQTTRREFLATVAGMAGVAANEARAGLRSDGDCSGEGNAAGPFRAGAAVTDITPEIGVSLDGLLMTDGPIEEIRDPLRARCLVLDNGETRLAIVLCDSCVISQELIDKAKTLAQQRTGLAKERMLVAATHTHMAPRLMGWSPLSELDRNYYDLVAQRIAEAIDQANDNLAPAEVGMGVTEQGNFLANRRWIMKPGNIVSTGGHPKQDRLKPAGPIDPDLTVLCVRHTDGKPLALLANYAAHYGALRWRKAASADYFGLFCERVGQLLNAGETAPPFVGIMSNGASGDIAQIQNASVEMATETLAAKSVGIFRSTDYRNRAAIAMCESEIELSVRKPSARDLAWANKVLTEPSGRDSVRAKEMLRMVDFPDTVSVRLQALRIGKAGIVAIPGEVFCETGLTIKKASPLKPTFVVSHANGWHGYLPPPKQHELGGMEVWLRRASYLEADATTKVEAEAARLLKNVGA